MVADSEIAENPFASPNAPTASLGRSKIVRWVLQCFAILIVAFSLPIAWLALEMANQEYLHIWNSNRTVYDIEFNGAPITIATAIRHALTAVLIMWSLAVALIVIPRFLTKCRPQMVSK